MKNELPVEAVPMTWEELRAMPEISSGKLKYGYVYLLEGNKYVATLNFLGVTPGLHPQTGAVLNAFVFDAPRAGIQIGLVTDTEGRLFDLEGNRVVVRQYTGEDR